MISRRTTGVRRTVTVSTGDQDDDDDDYMAIFSHTAEGNSDYITGGSITGDPALPVTADLRVTVNDLDSVSRDSKLSMLEISVNGDTLALDPSFDPDDSEIMNLLWTIEAGL